MEQSFWQDRWRNGQIGFHLGEINPLLSQHFDQLNLDKGAHVFVPLCGKSLDLSWLRQQGFKVTGNELSQTAIEAYFSEQKIQPDSKQSEDFTLYQHHQTTLICGDFFKLNAEQLSTVNAVYDRASLIALPKEMRTQYIQQLQAILPPKTPIFLITLDYNQDEMSGPPFSVSDQEVHDYYQATHHISCVSEQDILTIEPHFKEKGLSQLIERVYLLQPLK
ncbi:MAG: thiopurine S-methyltransferase [Methylococcales bacterium]|jgi:thiopurine S-methyltransferase|nr:thiopurine S-methyltransferase [Methylococcales bacterium]